VRVDKLAKKLEHYLSEVTGFDIVTEPIVRKDLSHSLSRRYMLYRLTIGKLAFTAIFLREEIEFKPIQFVKHMSQLASRIDDEFCLVAQYLSAYARKKLIELKIAFVVPGVQMYLPRLGMELRERSAGIRSVKIEHYSPASQVVLFYHLLGRIQGPITPTKLSNLFGYSSMTMSRVFDEYEATDIASVEKIGRSRFISFPDDRRTIWHKALPRLRSPIVQTYRVFTHELSWQKLLRAGLTALSVKTMLSEPEIPEYVLSRDEWIAMKKAGVQTIPVEEPETCMLQLWRYDPKMLEVDGCVDPFSLYLSLQDNQDERIELALEDLMEQYL